MKTFIVCFIIATALIISANIPAVQERPLDVVPRIMFYFGLPAGIFLGSIVLFIGERLGKMTGKYDSQVSTGQQKKIGEPKVA